MREVNGDESEQLTFFMYEELAAFMRAAQVTGLSRADIDAVFHGNAVQMLRQAGFGGEL
jgi:hypothetical protein